MHNLSELFIDKKSTPGIFKPKNSAIKVTETMVYLNYLTTTLNKLIMIRDASTILIQNDTNISSVHTDKKFNLLDGNLGVMSFSSDNSIFYGLNTLAGSFKIQNSINDALSLFNDDTINLTSNEDGDIKIERSSNETKIYTTLKPEFKSERNHDSEYLLLNYLSNIITHSGIKNGRLLLITERIPCKYCQETIIQFSHKHPSVYIDVMFLHSSGLNPFSIKNSKKQKSKSVNIDDDIDNLLKKQNDKINFYKADFSITINTIKLTPKDDGYLSYMSSANSIEQYRKYNMNVSPDLLRHIKSKK